MILQGVVEVIIRIPIGKDENGNPQFDFKKVAELGPGKSFGELAIIEDVPKPRSATIKARDD